MARGPALRETLSSGGALLGAWVNMNSPIATEIVAGAGFDLIVIDQEHGPGSAMDAIAQQQAIGAAGDVAGVLRVHDGDTQLIKRALDTGVDGIMVPLVETADEAALVVAACRLPPLGVRGTAPGNVRAARYGADKESFIAGRGLDVFVIVQIETRRAVENLPRIAAVDGIDMLFIGRNDLASSIGRLADTASAEARSLRDEAERRIKASGRFLGGVPGPGDTARDMFARGYDLVLAAADHALLREGADAAVRAARALT